MRSPPAWTWGRVRTALSFLRSLMAVTSDAHQGPTSLFGRPAGKRCRTHFMGDYRAPSTNRSPDPRPAPARGRAARGALPRGGRPLGRGDILAFTAFPVAQEAGVVEQPAGANKEIRRRTDVLPESGRRPAPRRRGVGRAARRVAGRPALGACLGRGHRRPHPRCCCPPGRLDQTPRMTLLHHLTGRHPERGTPTRRARVHYCLDRSGLTNVFLESFVETNIKDLTVLLYDLNSGAHGLAGRFTLEQLAAIKERVEDAIGFICEIVS